LCGEAVILLAEKHSGNRAAAAAAEQTEVGTTLGGHSSRGSRVG